MPQIIRSALVPYSAEQMFALVNDVEAYPEFLPGCVSTRLIEHTDSTMIASLDVAKAGIKKTFTTKNYLVDSTRIDMTLVDGPFKRLGGGWQFTPLSSEACKIELNLEFEFTNRLVEAAFGRIFSELTSSMVKAFTERAKEIYE